MNKKKLKKGFTLIELLIVITISTLLLAGSILSYTNLSRNSRDTRRKGDIEQIRSGLELYRSTNTNGSYPTSAAAYINCNYNGAINEVIGGNTNTYLARVPKDPKCSKFSYYYCSYDKDRNVCNGTANNVCVDYVIGAKLEDPGAAANCSDVESTCQSLVTDCDLATAGRQKCNYCFGSYGQLP